MRFWKLITVALAFSVLGPGNSGASEAKKDENCPFADQAATVPAPVDSAKILEAIALLKTTDGKSAITLDPEITKEVQEIFDTEKVKTKMEQFYSLLHTLGKHISRPLGTSVNLDPLGTRSILLQSKVFTDPNVPNQITAVHVDLIERQGPRYEVTFNQDQTILPLNQGQGFYLYKNGLCQHAQKLIFQKQFGVRIRKNGRGHTVAEGFKGVDLFGTFGNRGMFDVDINYVELRSVEFYRGTQNGEVTAYVSPEEFKKNDHNSILKIITRFVPDRNVTPIDW